MSDVLQIRRDKHAVLHALRAGVSAALKADPTSPRLRFTWKMLLTIPPPRSIHDLLRPLVSDSEVDAIIVQTEQSLEAAAAPRPR